MKNLLFFAYCIIFLFGNLNAQVPTTMPADANTFYDNSMPLLRPAVKNIVLQTAKAMKNHKANSDSLLKTLRNKPALKGMSNNDMEGVVVLIMVQTSKDADADLKNMVMNISHQNEQKESARTARQPKPEDDVKDMQNLKLQMIIDRKSNMAEEVGYVMKKISGTQQNIINNLK
jgi:hypothetical protein